jgi:hypothetical protein
MNIALGILCLIDSIVLFVMGWHTCREVFFIASSISLLAAVVACKVNVHRKWEPRAENEAKAMIDEALAQAGIKKSAKTDDTQ